MICIIKGDKKARYCRIYTAIYDNLRIHAEIVAREGAYILPYLCGIELKNNYPEILKLVGENIRKARKANGLSQEDLAYKSDIDPGLYRECQTQCVIAKAV